MTDLTQAREVIVVSWEDRAWGAAHPLHNRYRSYYVADGVRHPGVLEATALMASGLLRADDLRMPDGQVGCVYRRAK